MFTGWLCTKRVIRLSKADIVDPGRPRLARIRPEPTAVVNPAAKAAATLKITTTKNWIRENINFAKSTQPDSRELLEIGMTSIEVVVRGSLLGESVHIRPYLTKATGHTRISSSLADRLGLTEFRNVFIASDKQNETCEWKVSIFPIKIWCHGMQERRSLSVYPLINTNPQGAFYEMVLGRDSFQQLKNIANHTKRTNNKTQPTPGRAFNTGGKCDVAIDFVPLIRLPQKNAFFEYDCSESSSVFRLALNKVSRQLVVIYRSASTVYCYTSLSKRHEIAIERGESKGEIMTEVKVACHCKEVEKFPVAALVEPRFGVTMLL